MQEIYLSKAYTSPGMAKETPKKSDLIKGAGSPGTPTPTKMAKRTPKKSDLNVPTEGAVSYHFFVQ